MSHGAQRHRVTPAAESGTRRSDTTEGPGTKAAAAGDAPQTALRKPKSGGSSIDPRVLGEMEARFGTSFADVRIHDDADAHREAAQHDSKAFTHGSDIVFGADRHAPHTAEGKQLLAHELAHVVQQRRGGRVPDAGSTPALERDAAEAAGAVASGAASVVVGGASAPGVMHDRGDDDGRDRKAQRDREKARTQERKQGRSQAGKDEGDLREERVEKKMKSLEKSAQQPGAKSRSKKSKEKALKQFEEAAGGSEKTNLSKNKRKGNFDELQRTPSSAGDSVQEKYVAGGRQAPGMELRPGQDHYAQPDYSVYRTHADGTVERLHVNLKSNKIHQQSASQARATAKYNTDQAIKNAGQLPQGEGIIIDYGHSVPEEIQLEMLAEHFRTGSPIKEVRFGTTTHTRATYENLAVKLASKKPADNGGKKSKSKGKGNEKPAKSKEKTKAKENAKSKRKGKGKGKGKGKEKSKAKEEAKPKKSAKPKEEAKPKRKPKTKEKAQQTEPPKDAKTSEPKPESKAPEARTTPPDAVKGPAETPKPAAKVETTPKVETPKVEAPKVEGPKVEGPKGGSSMVGGLAEGASFLGDVSAVKGIAKEFAEGHPLEGLKDSAVLGLSHVPVLQAPMFAYAVGSTYWGPRHEQINEDAFDFGDAVQDTVSDIPIVGDIPYLPKIAGGVGAAWVAVDESVAYTVEGMGEAIADGAETLWDLGGEALAPMDWNAIIQQAIDAQKRGD